MLPSVAIVGRPNVGKSRLFNRIVGKRIAIVHDQAGVTRDLAMYEVERHYMLMDTGGIGMLPEMTEQAIFAATEEQVDFAVQAAQLVLFVMDGPAGCTPTDMAIATKLRQFNKQVLVVVNKMENDQHADKLDEFYQLGFGEPISVSAEHGKRITWLQEEISKVIGPKREDAPGVKQEQRVRICLAGRPNVGKSSLGNRLLNSERMIVSAVAGTTRDAIETDLDYQTEDGRTLAFRLIDTAGVRPKRKLGSSVEYFSTLRTEDAITKADIAFLVLDAQTGVTKHDKKIAGDILAAGVGLVIVVNKWDLTLETFETEPIQGFTTETEFRKSFMQGVRQELFFLPDSPVIFTSAKTNYAVDEILVQAQRVNDTLDEDIPTAKLNDLIEKMIIKTAPKLTRGKRFKIYYTVQVGSRPFRIRLFCNSEEILDDGYRRYLESGLHRAFGLKGCPIKFELVGKPKRYADHKKPKLDTHARNTLSKHGKARAKKTVRRSRRK